MCPCCMVHEVLYGRPFHWKARSFVYAIESTAVLSLYLLMGVELLGVRRVRRRIVT